MTYKIIYSAESIVQLKRFDNSISERIIKKIDQTCDNPLQFFERLAGREDYKLRIGDYRLIARILHSKKTFFLISIGHRRNIYKGK